MKTMIEIVELFGMSSVAETVAETGEVLIEPSNPARGYNFYSVDLKSVKGNPVEFASSKCTQDCFVTMDGDVMYVATKGTCSAGTKLK